jgi:hypothetical protein
LSPLVETHSGHRLHERPRRFRHEGVWYTVVRVLARWQEPGVLGFRVLADDGLKYTLAYNQEQDTWKISSYQHLARQTPPR